MINSSINVIGSIPDYAFITDLIALKARQATEGEIHKIVVENNTYNIRTEKSRLRFLRCIDKEFLQFQSEDHKTLIYSLFLNDSPALTNTKHIVLFWHFLISNELFFLITKDVFLPVYYSGRTTLKQEEIVSYLNNLKSNEKTIAALSESTLNNIASKYLTVLKKLGLLQGRQKKELKYIQVDLIGIVYFIYLITTVDTTNNDLMKNKYINCMFVQPENIINILKKPSYSKYFNIKTDGHYLNLDRTISIGELVNELSIGI